MTELDLTGDIQTAVDGAMLNGPAIVIAYVKEDGTPSLSYRGSTQVFSKDQVAVWARNPTEGLPANVAERPKVSLLYFNRNTPGPFFLNIAGRARVAPEDNDTVYDNMLQGERDRDPDKKGVAIVIDVDSVRGAGPDGPIQMER